MVLSVRFLEMFLLKIEFSPKRYCENTQTAIVKSPKTTRVIICAFVIFLNTSIFRLNFLCGFFGFAFVGDSFVSHEYV